MTSKQLFQSGRLDEAIAALGAELRDNPTDAQKRTFLFELLCFAGEYDRAEKHLNLLADQNEQAKLGAILYFSALHAERLRQEMFRSGDLPSSAAPAAADSIRGELNGKAFSSFEDSDPRIGTRLEVFAAGAYLWIPFEHITSVEMGAPKRLRDLLWIPALVRTGPAFQGKELGEVLIPALCPLSWQDSDANVRLGRATEWREQEGGAVPVGLKTFIVDDEDIAILDVRKLEFQAAEAAASQGGGE